MLIAPIHRQYGFTLMELAVVLMIVGLLLGGLFIPLSSQRDLQGRQTTEKALADIREALIGFAVINGRLPCPAQANISDNDPTVPNNAGVEAVTPSGICACVATSATPSDPGIAQIGATPCHNTLLSTDTTVGGVLPWVTLGLLETDATGNRYTYQVDSFFARGIDPNQAYFSGSCNPPNKPQLAAFALCTTGNIGIYSMADVAHRQTLASGVSAVVVSHGKNGLGAYTSLGGRITPDVAGDEFENSNGDATFVSNTSIDDQLVWIPTFLLMNRMIAAGKLP